MKNKEIINEYDVRSGVYAAIDPKITYSLDDYGQYEPMMSDSRDKGLGLKLQQVNAMSDISSNESQLAHELFAKHKGIKRNKIFGYYLDTYIGYVVEGEYRKNGSSGGFATWVLVRLLEEGLIDGVVHVHRAEDGDKVLFQYKISRTPDEIRDGSRSKYYPVELSEALKEIKKTPGRYAIVGIPSFITEIRLLQKVDPIIRERVKYTIGLVCGHQKSAKYAECLAWQVGIKPGDLKYVNFRKKIDGVASNQYSPEFTGMIDGKVTTVLDTSGKLLGSNWAHCFFKTRFSDFTDDAFNETADITLGDAWLPEYSKDSKGHNILIIRDPRISRIIEEGIKKELVSVTRVDERTIERSQSGLVHHNIDEIPYRLWKRDKRGDWRPKKRVEASGDFPFLRKRVQDLREAMAEKSHIVYREAVKRGDYKYFEKRMRPYVLLYAVCYRLQFLQRNGITGVIRALTGKPVTSKKEKGAAKGK